MSSINPVPGGYSILGANQISADLDLSPANGPCVVNAMFPRSAATGANALSACLIWYLPDGTQDFSSVPLHALTPPVAFPAGCFPGRNVTWAVADAGAHRTLTLNVTSTDGTGVDEGWELDISVNLPPGGETNFTVTANQPNANVANVGVVPPPA